MYKRQGLFNLGIEGKGVICLESPCPQEELIEVALQNDVVKIDGNKMCIRDRLYIEDLSKVLFYVIMNMSRTVSYTHQMCIRDR